MSKFIVVRGPSGAGKSTVAEHLHKVWPSRSLLLHEDKIRFMFSNWKEPDHAASKELMTAAIISGLNSGYDVIYEGISNVKTYDSYFQQIFSDHPADNYFYYMDVHFDETLKRHDSRPQKTDFGATEMKRWWEYASPTGYEFETILPQNLSLEQAVQQILDTTGLDERGQAKVNTS